MGLFSKIAGFFKSKRPTIDEKDILDDSAPVKKGEIPEMAITLGMIRPDHFQIYKLCDGNVDLRSIAEQSEIPVENVKKIVQKLYNMALVQFPTA